MPHKQRKSIISNRGQKRKQGEAHNARAHNARVPRKLRDKIVTDQYVDMSALLDTNPHADILSQDQVMYIQIAHNVVRPVPRRKSPQVLDISQWVMAFHLYIAIYTKAHPHEAANLLQYLMVVESITEEKGDWRVYDETFRFKRAESKTPWEKLDNELYTYVTRKAQFHLSVDQVPSSNPMPLTAESSSSFPLNANQYLASLNLNGGSNPNAQPNSPVIGGPVSSPAVVRAQEHPRYPLSQQQWAAGTLSGANSFPQPVQSFPVQSNSFRHPRALAGISETVNFVTDHVALLTNAGTTGGPIPLSSAGTVRPEQQKVRTPLKLQPPKPLTHLTHRTHSSPKGLPPRLGQGMPTPVRVDPCNFVQGIFVHIYLVLCCHGKHNVNPNMKTQSYSWKPIPPNLYTINV